MSETKFTPGPWHVAQTALTDAGYVVAGPDGSAGFANSPEREWIATVYGRPNAQLIAAAPKMYAALEALVNWWEEGVIDFSDPAVGIYEQPSSCVVCDGSSGEHEPTCPVPLVREALAEARGEGG